MFMNYGFQNYPVLKRRASVEHVLCRMNRAQRRKLTDESLEATERSKRRVPNKNNMNLGGYQNEVVNE